MLRMGASDRFIAMPYVFEAMLQVAIAALGAMLLTFALQQGVATNLVGLTFLPWTSVLGFLAAAVAVAWAASAAALTRILRTIGA